jgi:hypothetical protein
MEKHGLPVQGMREHGKFQVGIQGKELVVIWQRLRLGVRTGRYA